MYDKKTIIIIACAILIGFGAWYLFGSRNDVSDIGQSTDAVRTELSELKKQNIELRKQAEELRGGLTELKDGIGSVSNRLENATGKVDKLSGEIGAIRKDFSGIREILDSNDRTYKSVREAGPVKN